MHCVDLIHQAVDDGHVPALPEEPQQGVCAVTGHECMTIPAKHLLGASFTQWDLLIRPDSDRVGVSVWAAWMYGWREQGKKRDYRPERMSSWVVSPDGFDLLSRQQVRSAVLGKMTLSSPWAGYATTSYKKHGSLLAPVNGPGQAVWLWETRRIDCSDSAMVIGWWEKLRYFQDAGIPRPVLESADPEPHLIRKIGVPMAMEFADWSSARVQSGLYQFLCYLLPSAEELKGVSPQRDLLG